MLNSGSIMPLLRQDHNPHQLKCLYDCSRWFKSGGGCTKHHRIAHGAEVAMHPQQPADDPLFNYDDDPLFNDDEDPFINKDNNPFITQDDDPLINNNDDLLINNNPLLNEPFARSPAHDKSPLWDETTIHHHPFLNGAYTVIIACALMFKAC